MKYSFDYTMRNFILALALSTPVIQSFDNLEINEDPSQFESVFYNSLFDISTSDLSIHSNIPITFLRYWEENYNHQLVGSDEILVILKSKCQDETSFTDFEPEVLTVELDETSNFLNIAVDAKDANIDENLLPSSFSAGWAYQVSCENNFILGKPFNDTTFDTVTNIFGLVLTIVRCTMSKIFKALKPGTDTDTDTPNVSTSSSSASNKMKRQASCQVTAEIMFDACARSLNVTAPSIEVYEEHMNITSVISEPMDSSFQINTCSVMYEGVLTFPEMTSSTTTSPYLIEARDSNQCEVWIDGRPFIDMNGDMIQAEAHISDITNMEAHVTDWSTSEKQSDIQTMSSNQNEMEWDYEAFATDWTNRALGEHSSIASFAAFTIHLMTHNAPADLIADSLQAAMDEVNHARTAFDMASMLSRKTISPGALPASYLTFEYDLQNLALGTAKEGCIDETMSALLAAAEVQKLESQNVDLPGLWKEKVTVIAEEEAQHAALAWRTIHWVCLEDHSLCDVVMDYIRIQGKDRALRRLSSLDMDTGYKTIVENEWIYMVETLVETMMMNNDEWTKGNLNTNREGNFIFEIVDKIIGRAKLGSSSTI